MRFTTILLCSLVSSLQCASVTLAQNEPAHAAPWERSCASFASARDFVKESSYHCLRQQHQKRCERQARDFFEKCRYHGDYERMSARIHAKMLFVFALATSGPLAEGKES
jgi:hypothetical protein